MGVPILHDLPEIGAATMNTTTMRRPVTKTVYVLYCDQHDASGYFIRLGLGIFWECGPREMAREFTTRHAAVAVMQQAGKHREGWRVLAERKPSRIKEMVR